MGHASEFGSESAVSMFLSGQRNLIMSGQRNSIPCTSNPVKRGLAADPRGSII